MYKEFYDLKESPFSIQPDPDFLYFGHRHTYAYEMMKYAIKNNSNFIVISGEIGCGKTTLIRHLLNNWDSSLSVGLVDNTHRELVDLLEWIMLSFGLPYDGLSREELDDALLIFLIEQYCMGNRVLLIIDEAQNLSLEALESLGLLLNNKNDEFQLLQIMLVGQPELRRMLSEPELTQFSKRIEVDFHIKPLEAAEVRDYIHHRLKIAGRETLLFTPAACARIAKESMGIPRRINILCNAALVYGFSSVSDLIHVDLIEEILFDKAEFGIFSNTNFIESARVANSQAPINCMG